ncbi:hypothetical protein O181_068148 [Austropuccinia psidii MF-1]|uniref:Uncharacterized protein n=1 Tax=Austropuccinia psidii MF-1 TaxID=1389203 RepID=A0A9Q3EZY2_9BASI|nr:hypothetical protein [Austropuccinia psidii MF-1]
MVHTRNGSSYSVQIDGSGQGRGKAVVIAFKSFSRKTHLDDSRVATHSPSSVPRTFGLSSEPELSQHKFSMVEPLSSCSYRNILVPVQNLVQRSQERGTGNMLTPLEGGYELLLTHQEISGSGEDNRTPRRMESIFFKEKVKKIKNWLKSQILLSIEHQKELEMTPALEKEGAVVSTSSKPASEVSKEKPKGPQKKQRGPRKRQIQLAQTLPTRVKDPQIEPFSHGKCIQYGQNSYEIHSKGAGKDQQDLSMKLIDEIKYIKFSINVQLGKFFKELSI